MPMANQPDATLTSTPAKPEVLERVLPDGRRLDMLVEMKAHAGPLPPAEEFAAYGRVYERAPSAILEMAERQQKHDHWMDKSTLISESLYRIFGLVMAAAIPGAALFTAAYLAMNDKVVAASIIGTVGTLGTLGAAVIKGRDLRGFTASPEAPQPPQPRRPAQRRKK